ncbi:hypothetical protein [Rhodococcus globerulus]|uniref:Uncharacterized protein n=1 Tax=Rhodococcus globerulus TaxID=33008 RepID=A0ABU4C4X3_RHOGO|nr:hypothetical protein [Rhodococcus globerulus]MDV6271559.1 hypothetical protein [Rhodococcus globerulus]
MRSYPTAIMCGIWGIVFSRRWADWLVDLIPGAIGVVEIPGPEVAYGGAVRSIRVFGEFDQAIESSA